MNAMKHVRCAFAVGLATVGAVGCAGPVESNDADLPAEDVGTTEAAVVTCAPSRAITNTGFDLGTSQYTNINYVGASSSGQIVIQGKSSGTLGYTTRYIDLVGFTVSGTWGTMSKIGKISSIEIGGKSMKISGKVNNVSTTATLTFTGDISFATSSISGGPLGTVNRIFPYPAAYASGLTLGATTPFGSQVAWSTSNSTLSCF